MKRWEWITYANVGLVNGKHKAGVGGWSLCAV